MAKHARIYCTVGYERGRASDKGYVARFFRKSDHVQVGAASWNRKERKFENARGIGGKVLDMAQVDAIASNVPVLHSDGQTWYSHNEEPK